MGEVWGLGLLRHGLWLPDFVCRIFVIMNIFFLVFEARSNGFTETDVIFLLTSLFVWFFVVGPVATGAVGRVSFYVLAQRPARERLDQERVHLEKQIRELRSSL